MSVDGKRFALHAAAALILVRDGEVLLCRRYNTGWEDGKYGFMAGHLDGDEPCTRALCREAAEELGIIVDPSDLSFVHAQHHISNKEYIYLFFAASKWRGEPKIMEPDKCDDIQWFPINDLPPNLVVGTKFFLECYRKGVTYSESILAN